MKYSFNTPDTVLSVFAVLALFVLVQAIPDMDKGSADTADAVSLKARGDSYIAPVSFNENSYINDFSNVELEDIKASYLVGREPFGPQWQEPEHDPKPTIVYASVPESTEIVVEKPAKPKPQYAPIIPDGTPKIAIIIDDMGVSHGNSLRTIELDAPLTLAFLPYAEGLPQMTEGARASGHELMIHMPMQATTNPVSLGPIAIKAGMSADDVRENMDAAFETFSGYEGVNNHMGSKATQDPVLMRAVMQSLKERGLFFVDSRTISSSIAAETAREYELPVAVRDVFLDHEETPEFVAGALRKLEKAAVRKGHAIAIGHPKSVTINALEKWIPDAQARGFEIVHVSELLERPRGQQQPPPRVASSALTNPEPLESPELALAKEIAKIQPAAGDAKPETTPEKLVIAPERKTDVSSEDPNSAQARESILKRLLGQKTQD